METGIKSFEDSLDTVFGLSSKDWKLYSPLTLAYIGDAAYDLVVRTAIVKQKNMQTQKLHREATHYVNARAQAKMMETLLPLLTEEEAAIYRRGKNSSPHTTAKNATRKEYLEATGMEAVIGYLYLSREFDRMNGLIHRGMEALDACIL